jgi:hypothetical protein
LVERIQCWAIQCAGNRIDKLGDQVHNRSNIADDTLQNTRYALLCSLKCEAQSVVTLEQSLRIVDSTRDIANIDTSETVRGTSVTAYADNGGVAGCKDRDVSLPYMLGMFLLSSEKM